MARQTKAAIAERDEAIAKLREWIKPGDTVYTILDHVSSSGMSRAIRVVLPYVAGKDLQTCEASERGPVNHKDLSVDFIHPNYAIGKALDLRHWKRNGREQDALVIGGCGMDMGYHLVYTLARVLYPNFTCIGAGCPSNDHSNGDRDYTVGKPHSDGGYSLRHRWL